MTSFSNNSEALLNAYGFCTVAEVASSVYRLGGIYSHGNLILQVIAIKLIPDVEYMPWPISPAQKKAFEGKSIKCMWFAKYGDNRWRKNKKLISDLTTKQARMVSQEYQTVLKS